MHPTPLFIIFQYFVILLYYIAKNLWPVVDDYYYNIPLNTHKMMMSQMSQAVHRYERGFILLEQSVDAAFYRKKKV